MNRRNYLTPQDPGRYTLYNSIGELDGNEAAVNALPFRHQVQLCSGLSHLNLSTTAARVLMEHMQAAIDAIEADIAHQQGGEA